MTATTDLDPSDRNDAIKLIRAALKRRSGKTWSVTGDRGTAWGWLQITAPPARRDAYDNMTEEDRAELAALLGMRSIPRQGVSVPASGDHRREYVDRAEGCTPTVTGATYWD